MNKKKLGYTDVVTFVYNNHEYKYRLQSYYIYSMDEPLGRFLNNLGIRNGNKFIEYHYGYYVHGNEFNPCDYEAPTRLLYALDSILTGKYDDKISGLFVKQLSNKLFTS